MGNVSRELLFPDSFREKKTRNTQKNISLRPDIDILDDSVDSKSSKVGDISKSDSMIPLVGDSILSQNVTLDT